MTESTLSFDFVVIGGGSAGYAAARTAVSLGLKTAVIDGAEVLGGLCILRGCMPSKALIESANRAISIRRAEEFGLKASAGAADIAAIRKRKRVLIDDFAGYRQEQLQKGTFALLRGRAAFAGPKALEVTLRDGECQRVEFTTACIATGSQIKVPPVPGLQETGFWTSDEILDAEALPGSFIVLGGGAIALEMAHYLESMGRSVTLVQRSKGVLTNMDPECGEVIVEAFRKRGMKIHCGTHLQSVEKTAEGGKRVTFKTETDTETVEADEILVATGRAPSTMGLGLQEAGVVLKHGKIEVSPTMQTSLPHVFAAGDVCSPVDVVHIAIQQGEIAAQNAAAFIQGKALPQKMDYRLALFGVFSAPQTAAVGATEEELKKAGVPYRTASYPFNDHGKSMVMGETEGFVKLIAHATSGEILGACIVGPEATELIHEITVAMAFRSTAAQLLAIPHYHPTLSEIWTYPAEELADSVSAS
ncbi:MAG: putative Dihydrolipoyl dehydrogenase, component of pyruvate and 2-oxoglutarate dehydrogenase [Verrucomicrobiaceae bacterium]|nr:putative Dihydrolipoyl dehydrogenase, component of pyruvate and 2-oxoglutarate dehydrogenase [Verrucomicrobiaceae bacterium]